MLVEFCRSVTPSPHVRVIGHLQLAVVILYLVMSFYEMEAAVTNLLQRLKFYSSRMQAFVRFPTEFDNLLLNAAGYFDVSPKVFNSQPTLFYKFNILNVPTQETKKDKLFGGHQYPCIGAM